MTETEAKEIAQSVWDHEIEHDPDLIFDMRQPYLTPEGWLFRVRYTYNKPEVPHSLWPHIYGAPAFLVAAESGEVSYLTWEEMTELIGDPLEG